MERFYDGDQEKLFAEAHVINPFRKGPVICRTRSQNLMVSRKNAVLLWIRDLFYNKNVRITWNLWFAAETRFEWYWGVRCLFFNPTIFCKYFSFIILFKKKIFFSSLLDVWQSFVSADDDWIRMWPPVLYQLLGRISHDQNHGRRSGPDDSLRRPRLRHSRGRRQCHAPRQRLQSQIKISASHHKQFRRGKFNSPYSLIKFSVLLKNNRHLNSSFELIHYLSTKCRGYKIVSKSFCKTHWPSTHRPIAMTWYFHNTIHQIKYFTSFNFCMNVVSYYIIY